MRHSLSTRSKTIFKAVSCALVGALLMVPAVASAEPTAAERQEQAEAELAAVEQSAAEKQAEAQEALARLNAMQETLDRLSADYGQALMEQEAAEARRDEAQQRIAEIEEQIDQIQARLGDRAREMYRSGNISYLEVLFGSASFEEFTTNLDLLTRVNQSDADLIEEQRELRLEAVRQRNVYEEQAEIAAQKSAEAAEAAEQAQATVAEMQATYDSLSDEAAALLEEQRQAEIAVEEARAQAEMERAAPPPPAAEAAARAAANAAAVATGGVYDFSNDQAISAEVAYEGGNDTVSRAYACLGAPYVWGAVGPYGYDCSGLVSYCLSGSHIRLGTTYTFMEWPQVSDPQPGDICTNWTHCGVYIGGGQMIHAADYGIGVIIGPVQSGMIIVRY